MARTPPPDYGIIYNWDGTPHGYSEYPQTAQQLVDLIYAPIKDTQVGAMTWCVGAEEARWPSKQLPLYGSGEGRRYDDVEHTRRVEGLWGMYDRGENPYGAIVRGGRELGMHVYAAVRMNDNHFWSDKTRTAPPLTPETITSVSRHALTSVRKGHPEWLLGADQAPRWASTSWNLAIPEVRQMRLTYIEETCRLADWDGIEIDWQRHAFHLPEHDAYRLMYTLTDLQRGVRSLTDRIAQERGRPFYVLVRVGATLETCHKIGYDLET